MAVLAAIGVIYARRLVTPAGRQSLHACPVQPEFSATESESLLRALVIAASGAENDDRVTVAARRGSLIAPPPP